MKKDSFYLYKPTFIPDPEVHQIFKESIEISCTLTFDSWTSSRKTINTGLNYQFDVGSSLTINSSKNSISAHQTEATAGLENKAKTLHFAIMLMLENVSFKLMELLVLRILLTLNMKKIILSVEIEISKFLSGKCWRRAIESFHNLY